MPIDAGQLQILIADELALVADDRVVSHVRSMLVEPYSLLRHWDYGAPGQQFPCWMVLNDTRSNAEIAYCEYGFGPRRPWGLVGSGAHQESMGMDSGWFPTFMDAFFESYACVVLPIWRVVHVHSEGKRTVLTDEGDWDATWSRVMELRLREPHQRYDCEHTIAYGQVSSE